MITINLGVTEKYNSELNQFEYEDKGVVRFEYSLRAVYEWEGVYKKPFLKGKLTSEESLDFYIMMALDPVNAEDITPSVARLLSEYIDDPSTATTFSEHGQNGNKSKTGKVYTSEEIYALMATSQIDLEWEYRNLNRLLAVLRVVSS